jgi:hypothetical protein
VEGEEEGGRQADRNMERKVGLWRGEQEFLGTDLITAL